MEAKQYGLVDEVLGNTDDVVVHHQRGADQFADQVPALTKRRES
jgi:hypothetical protein